MPTRRSRKPRRQEPVTLTPETLSTVGTPTLSGDHHLELHLTGVNKKFTFRMDENTATALIESLEQTLHDLQRTYPTANLVTKGHLS